MKRPKPGATQKTAPIGLRTIVRWQRAGLSDRAIVEKLEKRQARLSGAALRRLRRLGVRPSLIESLRELHEKVKNGAEPDRTLAKSGAEAPTRSPTRSVESMPPWTDPIVLRDRLFLSRTADHRSLHRLGPVADLDDWESRDPERVANGRRKEKLTKPLIRRRRAR